MVSNVTLEISKLAILGGFKQKAMFLKVHNFRSNDFLAGILQLGFFGLELNINVLTSKANLT